MAKHLRVPASFVSKMANGERPVPIEHGAGIEMFTHGVVSRKAMWPADWVRIWPELRATQAITTTETTNV